MMMMMIVLRISTSDELETNVWSNWGPNQNRNEGSQFHANGRFQHSSIIISSSKFGNKKYFSTNILFIVGLHTY